MASLASTLASLPALLALLALPPPATGGLQTLHVRAFSLSADRNTVHVGEPVHVTIAVRVDEDVPLLNNVILPDLSGFENGGDERRVTATPAGTSYVESITLVPTEAGTRKLGPAYLDAIDASSKPPHASRFGSNTIEIRVLPVAAPVAGPIGAFLSAAFWIGVVSLGLALFLRLRKPQVSRVTRLEPPPSTMPAPSDPLPSEAERWRALVDALADHPTRENVVAVRSLLRQQAGAREDETFGDILARQTTRVKPELLESMRAVERAAFIDDANLPAAVREAVGALRRYAGVVGP